MKGILRRWFMLIAVVGLAASCSSGGGDKDKDFDFNGRWAWNASVTGSNVPTTPVGDRITDVLIIVQNGTNVIAMYESLGAAATMTGTCDPKAGTFNASGPGTGPYAGTVSEISGARVDDDSMSGTFRVIFPGARFFSGTWTANFASRSAAGPAAGGASAAMRNALEQGR